MCRLIASIGLHTQGKDHRPGDRAVPAGGPLRALPAEREAIRGTFNPEYFCYTLGKLAILEARTKHLAAGSAGPCRRSTTRLLGFGCPPIGMLDELLAGA